jgi:hypothetical protein
VILVDTLKEGIPLVSVDSGMLGNELGYLGAQGLGCHPMYRVD